MRRSYCSALAFTLAAVPSAVVTAWAQRPIPAAPDSVAAEFQTAIRVAAWGAAARRMHPEALQRIHQRIDILVEADTSGKVIAAIFNDMSETEYRELASADVFVAVMEAMNRHIRGVLYFIVIEDIEILGTVEEPPELAHVVYRSSAQLSGAVPEVRVMTLKRTADGWRVFKSPELETIREAARGFIMRPDPPPPPGT
ncbi:MAG: hypothetical protein PVJ64_03070 [Gemmatimonadales bacterium]|jgi:hypothetical protein